MSHPLGQSGVLGGGWDMLLGACINSTMAPSVVVNVKIKFHHCTPCSPVGWPNSLQIPYSCHCTWHSPWQHKLKDAVFEGGKDEWDGNALVVLANTAGD